MFAGFLDPSAFIAFLESLMAGDPIALGIAGFFLFVGTVLGLFTWKIARDHRREDAERARKLRPKPPKRKAGSGWG